MLAALKWGSLLTITIQNAALIVLACYTRALPGPQYLGSVAVLLTELLKAAIILVCAVASSGADLPGELRAYMLRQPRWTALFAIPALCYNVHNNLWYVAGAMRRATHEASILFAMMACLHILNPVPQPTPPLTVRVR